MKKGLTLLLSLVLVLAMSVTAFAAEDWVTPVQNIEKWDEEVDFLVVGYGLAGAAAAVEAYDIDPTAKILVLEKMPETLAGGNSIASGQTFLVPAESAVETVKTYLYNCNKPNPIPDEYLTWLCEGFATQLPWIEYVADGVDYEAGYVGGGELKWGSMVVEFSNFEGSTFDGCSAHLRAKGSTFENGGVWRCFAKAVEKRGIDVRFENPAVSLVQDPFTKEVSGVIARRADGTEYSIKSAKGVLLACGGYENNLTMQRDFHGMETVYTAGTPGNTGDGIKMLMEAGAQIWHMKNQTQSGGFWLGIKVPEYDSTFMRNFTMAGNSWIEIDSESKRFYDEAGSYHRQHMKYMEYGRYVDLPHERALPVSLIFDEKTREAGSIGSQWLSWPTTTEGYTWSNDNLAEIEKGWIIKADTIEELAEKIGKDPAKLRAEVDKFNAMVDAGEDTDFGRDITTMAKIEQGPFYAVEEVPSMPACSGGARRNIKGQVLNWDGEPIEGLYSAGEIGSLVCNLYQNGTYLHEAICSGRAAVDTMLGGRAELTPTFGGGAAAPWAEAADGDYSVMVQGLHDPFEIIYTIKDKQLVGIAVGEGRENMFMNDEQFAAFTKQIIETQDMGVDAVSGATVDCQAITGGIMTAFSHKTS